MVPRLSSDLIASITLPECNVRDNEIATFSFIFIIESKGHFALNFLISYFILPQKAMLQALFQNSLISLVTEKYQSFLSMKQQSLVKMCNTEEKLLQNKCVANVLQIYLNDFKEIIYDIGLITYRLSKTLIQSWIMKITQFPKNVAESSVQEFKHFFDLGPIPNDFDYSFLTISNFWDYIIINAKCYGENFANSYIGHQTFGLSERRFCALILSFMIGASTHQLYLKWQQPILPAPPYYSPFVVAFVIEYNVHLTDEYFITDRSDYATAHDHIALPINSMYNQLICTILFGTYIPNRAPHEAIPDAFEEQYTMIAH
uniref:Uncharacterized protein n=2 Tax=Onchocercidae TaxID=6296 RepID=A0AAF5RX75_WUCBA